MQNLGATALPDTWVWQRQTGGGIPSLSTVRFHFDNRVVSVPIINGQLVQELVPTPATRYGRPGVPGQAFMGWFTEPNPSHYINNPNRAVAFDLTQLITADMLTGGVLNLHGSWLQHGDVNGDGVIGGADVLLLRQFMVNRTLNIIHQTADVNGDGVIGGADVLLLRQFMVNRMLVLGIPAPYTTYYTDYYAVITSQHPQMTIVGQRPIDNMPVPFNIWESRTMGQEPIHVANPLGTDVRRGQLVRLSANTYHFSTISGIIQFQYRIIEGVVDNFISNINNTLFSAPMGTVHGPRNVLMSEMRNPASLTSMSVAAAPPSEANIARVAGTITSFSDGVLVVNDRTFTGVNGNFPVIEFYNVNDVRFGSMSIHNPTFGGRLWRTYSDMPMEDHRAVYASNLNAVVWYNIVCGTPAAIILIRACDRAFRF